MSTVAAGLPFLTLRMNFLSSARHCLIRLQCTRLKNALKTYPNFFLYLYLFEQKPDLTFTWKGPQSHKHCFPSALQLFSTPVECFWSHRYFFFFAKPLLGKTETFLTSSRSLKSEKVTTTGLQCNAMLETCPKQINCMTGKTWTCKCKTKNSASWKTTCNRLPQDQCASLQHLGEKKHESCPENHMQPVPLYKVWQRYLSMLRLFAC